MSNGNSVVHLELHTGNLARACAFYTRVFGWRAETVHAGAASYLALALGDRVGGGIVECEEPRDLWLPYVAVTDVHEAVERARHFGGAVALEPREGPVGWRSVVAAPSGAQVGLWQPKR
jgi:predicted enzyme related to lactoylglutathione lyase